MPTHYLATASTGQIVSRKSTNPTFTHAAIQTEGRPRSLPNFSTSAPKAAALFANNFREVPPYEVVELRKVDAAEFRAATKGIDPQTGRPRT